MTLHHKASSIGQVHVAAEVPEGLSHGRARLAARLRTPMLALLFAGALQATAAPASAPSPTETLRRLVESGQFEQAYSLGSTIQLEYEGLPNFDFYFGLSALETGHYQDAAFALERAAITRPDQSRIRLELARAFFLTNDFAAARTQFQSVLDESPPQAVRDNIQAYLTRMDELETAKADEWTFFVETASGYDDNVNSATGVGSIDTPFGNFSLTDDGQAQDDQYLTVSGAVAWKHKVSGTGSVDVSLLPSYRANLDASAFDIGVLRLESGYSQVDGNLQWRLGARAQVVTVDQERFQDGYGLVGSLTRDFGDGWYGSLTGTATTLRFDGDKARDTDQYILAVGIAKQSGALSHSLSVYGASEPAREDDIGEHNGKAFYGATYGLQWAASQTLVPFVAFSVQTAEYDADHPVFAVTREDDQFGGRIGVQWLVMPRLVVRGEYRYTEVDSNLEVFKIDRNEVEAGFRYSF
jgi:tetratricopeptide (TPR) repeat protein